MKTKLFTFLFFCYCTLPNAQTLYLNDAQATIGPGASFTFGEVINDDPADLMIKSDETGSGSLIYTNTENPQPHATVEIWVGETENWHLVSPTTTNVSSADFYIEGMQPTGLMWYDENINTIPPPAPNSQNGWTSILDLDSPINVGQGYGYYQAEEQRSAETGKVTFTGQLKSDDVTYGNSGLGLLQWSGPYLGNYGWNLIGNPYSSALIEDMGTPSLSQNIEGAIWIWEGGTTNNYIVWRFPPAPGDGDHPLVIPMGQAFFVHAYTANPDLTIFADNRGHNHNTKIYKKSEDVDENPYGRISLIANNNEALDKLLIEIPIDEIEEEGRLLSISKLFGPPESPQLYSKEGDREISIQTYDSYVAERVVDVAYIPGDEGEQLFTFNIDLPEESEVYLEDLLTGWMQDVIENPEYIFLGSKEDDVDRFRIHFTLSPDGLDNFNIDHNLNIYAWDKAVYIKNPNPVLGSTSLVRIYDMYGKIVYSDKMHLSSLTRIPVLVNSSYMVVKVRNGDEVIAETIFVQ